MTTISERRARFVYEGMRLIEKTHPESAFHVPYSERDEFFKIPLRKAVDLECGSIRSKSPEELHEKLLKEFTAVGWKYGETCNYEEKKHPELVPYVELKKPYKDRNDYFFALCDIARQWVE